MSKVAGALVAILAVAMMAMLPQEARAQMAPNEGLGSAISGDALQNQGMVRPGVDDMQERANKDRPYAIIKDVQMGLKDADPNVRVLELAKLRNLQSPEVNGLLLRGLNDPDIRVKIKAIDILGARETTEAVPEMSQQLFLRSTPPLVKLHLVAALGRIGDANGTLPVMQYLEESTDPRARGTAVFALGEMGDPRASALLMKVVTHDSSPMVRRLAQEALEKIDGELPTAHSAKLLAARDKQFEPTDQKLAKMRAMDEKMQQMER